MASRTQNLKSYPIMQCEKAQTNAQDKSKNGYRFSVLGCSTSIEYTFFIPLRGEISG